MSEQEFVTSPTRPYLARAIYEWVCDNQLTPYLLVDATQSNTHVPVQFVKDGQIVLNIAPHAVHQFEMSNDAISFSARFGGVSQNIYVPLHAAIGIYAKENGQGLFFDPNEYENVALNEQVVPNKKEEPVKKKSGLRIVED